MPIVLELRPTFVVVEATPPSAAGYSVRRDYGVSVSIELAAEGSHASFEVRTPAPVDPEDDRWDATDLQILDAVSEQLGAEHIEAFRTLAEPRSARGWFRVHIVAEPGRVELDAVAVGVPLSEALIALRAFEPESLAADGYRDRRARPGELPEIPPIPNPPDVPQWRRVGRAFASLNVGLLAFAVWGLPALAAAGLGSRALARDAIALEGTSGGTRADSEGTPFVAVEWRGRQIRYPIARPDPCPPGEVVSKAAWAAALECGPAQIELRLLDRRLLGGLLLLGGVLVIGLGVFTYRSGRSDPAPPPGWPA